ncbi:hypothetical protein, variant [Verruconis gallopava]|nr:hypothetical protein, variant [Verruconis gallopava]KIW05397.1 hypothetical protein, variant [Verruconis gallopava]
MSVQWGLPMLEDVLPKELFDTVSKAANDPYFTPPDPGVLPTWNGATGEHIKDVPLLRMYRVSRRRFRAHCAQGINISYGKVFDHYSFDDAAGTVTAHFKDGTTATGTTLIGTDGAQSPVRMSIFGPEKGKVTPVPYCGVNLHVKYGDKEKALFVRQKHPIMTHAIHPDGYWLWISIQDVPDPNDPATWTFQLQCTWKNKGNDDPTDYKALMEKAKTFGEPFKSAFLWVPEGTPLYANFLSYWRPQPFDTKNGRITLLGDAAHPMTFQRGQGLNHCIADARTLSKEFEAANKGEKTLAEAIEAYQEEMIRRAGEEVEIGIGNTEMLHDWSRFLLSPLIVRGGDPNKPKS